MDDTRAEGKPTPREIERGTDALVPFIQAWGLPLNPEELTEMAYAVLKHSRLERPWEEIEKEINEQIQGFERGQAELANAVGRS